ncbi:hypothetical protein MRB53_004071 [Persea americana]|uniref:Uncharacterized protein n=1 Tax=Persea americana TaxID=3435 RepID=A0ACC2MZT7_PERAE|nr:hypothetical protein MRB53_004071 [Persea americana]
MLENQTNTPQIVIHREEHCSDSFDSTPQVEEEEYTLTHTQFSDSLETLQFKQMVYQPELEQEVVSLKNQVSELQHREGELEELFLRYCMSQEHESALKEIRSSLEFEITHVGILGLKVEIMEAENRRLELNLSECSKVIEELGSARTQMQSMQRKVKKLVRTKREGLSAFRRQASVLQEREADISSKNEELKQRKREIEELEAAVVELRRIVDKLQMEKSELMERLELAENLDSSSPKMIAEDPNQQGLDCEELLTQIEQLQNERAADMDELIYLRWTNACLRYELMRSQEQQHCEENNKGNELVLDLSRNSEVENCEVGYGWDNQEQQCGNDEKGKQSVTEISGNEQAKNCEMGYGSDNLLMGAEHGEPSSMDPEAARPAAQTKPMLFGKLKRWAKGKERRRTSCDEKENQHRCSGRCSVSDMAIEDFTARNSCSPVRPCFWVENAP